MTKQHCISSILFFFGLFLYSVSCTNQRSTALQVDNYIDFDTIVVSERHHLHGDSLQPFADINVSFVFPVRSQQMDVETLQHFFIERMFGIESQSVVAFDVVQQYKQAFFDSFLTDARIFNDHARDFSTTAQRDEISEHEARMLNNSFVSYYETLSNIITFNQNGVLAFQVKQSNRRGDFIAFESFRNYVIDLQSGEQVTEYDIFNQDFESSLQRILIASLLEQNGVQTIDELEDLGFFGIEEIMPNGNFLLDDRGITYLFNTGEYSVHQIEPPVVFIPYRSIRTLLRRNSVAARLADL